MKRLTTREFIGKARAVHGDNYDYSLTEYVSQRERVKVICRLHGEFLSPPGHHLAGTGCPQCGRAKVEDAHRSTLEDFIVRAQEKHGGEYDYSASVYLGSAAPLLIRCAEHGEFWQRPDNHLAGNGCPKCGRRRTEDSHRLDAEEFFKRCREAHGSRYEYPVQAYSGPDTLLKIVCPEHGLFFAGARNHLWNKHRCPKCARKLAGELRRIKRDDWLLEAGDVHGNRYEYDLTNFEGGTERVLIKCSKHGWFKQRGHLHLLGQGCPKCARERLNGRWRPETLSTEYALEPCNFYYMLMTSEDEAFYKVGISNDVHRRMRTLRASGYAVELIFTKEASRKECLEVEIAVFAAYDNIAGYTPKRQFPGSSECFATDILGLHKASRRMPAKSGRRASAKR